MATMLKPQSTSDVEEIIAWALSEKEPLSVRGFGSKPVLGGVEADHILDLTDMHGITAYEPGELTLRVLPGTKLSEIEAALHDEGQCLAFEPPDFRHVLGSSASHQSIGGIIAMNLSGPRRIAAGAARDHFLGFEAVSGRGEKFKAGGHVVKNVTGYDLSKLMAGSFGTLAIMTALTLKVLPQGESEKTCRVRFHNRPKGLQFLRQMTGTSLELTGFAFAGDTEEPYAAFRSEGTGDAVSARIERLKDLLPQGAELEVLDAPSSKALWRGIRDVPMLRRERGALWRCSMPPTGAAAFLDRTVAQLDARYVCDWAGGLIWLSTDRDSDDIVPDAASDAGGHATLFFSSDHREQLSSPMPAGMQRLHRQIKAGFDPEGILNPGRMPGLQ